MTPVTLPYQNTRGRSRTIIGALGLVDGTVHFFYIVADRTSQDTVVDFFEAMKSQAPFSIADVTVVTDNHSAHRSRTVKEWLLRHHVQMRYLPAYSSVLSPVERVWSIFKGRWAKELSKVKVAYDVTRIDNDIRVVLEQVR